MRKKLGIIVNPGDISDCNEETVKQAALNALIVKKGFFRSFSSKVEKRAHVVVFIETADQDFSKEQREFVNNLREEGVIESYFDATECVPDW